MDVEEAAAILQQHQRRKRERLRKREGLPGNDG